VVLRDTITDFTASAAKLGIEGIGTVSSSRGKLVARSAR
jgi:hypothetical protein